MNMCSSFISTWLIAVEIVSMRKFVKISQYELSWSIPSGHRSILCTSHYEVSPFFHFGAPSRYCVRCLRHHGETPAVCRCLSELLRISPGGQYVALSTASLHCLPGGHQHSSAVLRAAVSPPGQPQHCSGGEAQSQRYVEWSSSWDFPPKFVGGLCLG